jgi:uncharacterized protein YbaP (TraB family)
MTNNFISNIKKITLRPILNKCRNTKDEKVYNGVFYKVEKEGKYFYVGGSIHVGISNNIRFNNIVEKAFEDSTKIAVELDMTKVKNHINMYKSLLNITPDQVNLKNKDLQPELLPLENNKKFDAFCKNLGLNPQKYAKLSPEKFYTIANQKIMKKTGYKSNYGIDNYFINRAKKSKKEIISLETPAGQITALIAASNMSPEALGSAKIKSLEDLEASIESFSKMHDSIFEGDILTLVNELLIYKPVSESDRQNLNALIYERNEKMANKIESLLVSEETYFVIVGAAHVIGKGGLLKLFKDKGYKTSRLQ